METTPYKEGYAEGPHDNQSYHGKDHPSVFFALGFVVIVVTVYLVITRR